MQATMVPSTQGIGPGGMTGGPPKPFVAEDKVSVLVEEMMQVETLESAFNLFLVHSKEAEESKRLRRQEEWLDILRACSELKPHELAVRQTELALTTLISRSAGPPPPAQPAGVISALMTLLEAGVQSRLLDARKVCENLLNSEHMKHDNKLFWISAFKLVRKIIYGVDYKVIISLTFLNRKLSQHCSKESTHSSYILCYNFSGRTRDHEVKHRESDYLFQATTPESSSCRL